MPEKLKTARVCLLIQAWLSLIVTAITFLVFVLLALGLGFSEQSSTSVAGISFGVFAILLGVIGGIITYIYFLAAKGLSDKKEWGRVLATVLGILALFNFPIGTVLGVLILIGVLDEGSMAWFGPQDQ